MTFLSRVYVVPTDLGIYLTAILFIALTQLTIWLLARYSADIEIWRCLALCGVSGGIAIVGASMGGLNGLLAGWVFAAFIGYLLIGFVYEFELWQRIVVSIVTPPIALLSFLAGYWLKDLLLSTVFAP